MKRVIPPKPEFIVKGNDGHMPRRGVWQYDAFYVNDSTFVFATVTYRVNLRDCRPDSLTIVVCDAECLLQEVWGPDGELIDATAELRLICRENILDWFWEYDANKIMKLELKVQNEQFC